MPDPKDFSPTPAVQWVDRHPPQEVTLPSGNRAVVKRPNFYIFGRSGQVPKRVQKAQERREAAAESRRVPSPEHVAERLEDVELMVNWAMTKAFVDPVVSLDPREGAVLAADISADDKTYVLEFLEIEV